MFEALCIRAARRFDSGTREVTSMLYSLLADLVVAAHIAFVAYIVVGLALLLAGVWRRWAWVRNPWFRFTHLAAVLVVVLELVLDTRCPLTVLEAALRSHAGEPVVEATFLSRLMHKFLFGPIPIQVSNALYYLFALATAAALVLAPPRRRRLRQAPADFPDREVETRRPIRHTRKGGRNAEV